MNTITNNTNTNTNTNNNTNNNMDAYGLLSNEATAVMQNQQIVPNTKLLVLGRKGILNTRMMFDWWYVYAAKNNLIFNNKWIAANDTLNALLADEYIKFGAVAGTPFSIQMYFSMLGKHIYYNNKLELSPDQKNYLINQANNFRIERSQFV